jgi:hypothetical protein
VQPEIDVPRRRTLRQRGASIRRKSLNLR